MSQETNPTSKPPRIVLVPTNKLVAPEWNPRKFMEEAAMLVLMAYIRAGGTVPRILVWAGSPTEPAHPNLRPQLVASAQGIGNGAAPWSIISGQRRWIAFKRLGYTQVEVEILDIPLEDAKFLALSSNQGVEVFWLDWDVAIEKRYEEGNQDGKKLTQVALAARSGVSQPKINYALKVAGALTPASRELIYHAVIKSGDPDAVKERPILALAALGDPAQVEKALPMVLAHQMTEPKAKAYVAWIKAGHQPEEYLEAPPPAIRKSSSGKAPVEGQAVAVQSHISTQAGDKGLIEEPADSNVPPLKKGTVGFDTPPLKKGVGFEGTQGPSPVSSLGRGDLAEKAGGFAAATFQKAVILLGQHLPKALKSSKNQKTGKALNQFYQTFLKPILPMFQGKFKFLLKAGIGLILLWVAYGVVGLAYRAWLPKAYSTPNPALSSSKGSSLLTPDSQKLAQEPVFVEQFLVKAFSPDNEDMLVWIDFLRNNMVPDAPKAFYRDFFPEDKFTEIGKRGHRQTFQLSQPITCLKTGPETDVFQAQGTVIPKIGHPQNLSLLVEVRHTPDGKFLVSKVESLGTSNPALSHPAVSMSNPPVSKASKNHPLHSTNPSPVSHASQLKEPSVPPKLQARVEDDSSTARFFAMAFYSPDYRDLNTWFDILKSNLVDGLYDEFMGHFYPPAKIGELKDQKLICYFDPKDPPKLLSLNGNRDSFLVEGIVTIKSDLRRAKEVIATEPASLEIGVSHPVSMFARVYSVKVVHAPGGTGTAQGDDLGKMIGDTLKDIPNAVSTVGEGENTVDKAKKALGL